MITRVWSYTVVGTALWLAVTSSQAQPGPPRAERPPPSITVSAAGEVSTTPDRAVVRLGVIAQAAEAADAQNAVNAIMERITEALGRLDVEESAIRTEDLSLYPVYDDRPVPNDEAREPRIVGYRASNVVSVATDELERIGAIIDAGIKSGANQLQGVSFELRDDATARAEAMRRAVREARDQAEAIADALGLRLGGVREVIAGGYQVAPPRPYAEARYALAEAATPVQPGQVDVSANVTVIFELGAARN